MARPAKLHIIRQFGFGLEPRQIVALGKFRKRHGLKSDAQAVRCILNAVADSEEVSITDYPTGEPCS